jgi:hypothetical protein
MRLMRKAVVVLTLSSLTALPASLWAGACDPEAGGPKQHDRAVREQAADRAAHGNDGSQPAKQDAPRTANSPQKASDVRNMPALTVTKEGARQQAQKDAAARTATSTTLVQPKAPKPVQH